MYFDNCITKYDKYLQDARYGGYTDVGGSYIGRTQSHVMKLVQELGLKTYHIYTAGKSVMRIRVCNFIELMTDL